MTKGSKKDYSGDIKLSDVLDKPLLDNSVYQNLKSSYDPAFILSHRTNYVIDYNEAFEQFMLSIGYTAETALADIFPKYQPNNIKSLSIIQDIKSTLILSGVAQRFDIYLQNGIKQTPLSVEITATPLTNHSSSFFCVLRQDRLEPSSIESELSNKKLTIQQDKQSSEVLLQKLKEYKSIIDSSPAAIIKTDLLGRITFVSNQAIYLHGLPEKCLLYKHIDEIFNINGNSFFDILQKKLVIQKKGQGRKIIRIHHPRKGDRILEVIYNAIVDNGLNEYLLSYIDITEKEHFKSSLEHSNAKLDSIIGLSNTDIIQITKDGVIESISSESLVKSEIIGQQFSSFLTKESKTLFECFIAQLIEYNSKNVSELIEIQFPQEQKSLFQLYGKILFDKSRNKESILLVCHNYTDKMRSEIALIKKESTVHTLLENSPFSIYAIDKNLNVTFINSSAIADFKRFQQVDIQLGDNLKDKVPKAILKNWRSKIFKRVFAGEKFSRTGLIKGVEDIIIENKYSPIVDHFGNISGCIEVSQDISDLKLKEYQLIEREAYLTSILNSSPHGIIVLDSEHNITGVNTRAIRSFMTIYKQDIEIHSNLKDILPKDIFETINNIKKSVFKGDIVSYVEKIEKEGKFLYFEHTFSPVKDNSNAIIGCMLLIRDDTQVIEFEDLLRHKNRELETYIESNLSLENFANIASHDLKSPLRTIIGFTQLLKRDINNDLSEKNKVFLSHIIKSSKNMQELIDDILLFSKLNTVEPTIEEIVFETFITFIISQLEDELKESKSIVKFRNLPRFIHSDKIKLAQVIQNLIRNGIKFQEQNTIPEIMISVDDRDHYWQINVQDNGIGIEEKYASDIFKIFKRLHTKGDYPGSGIGLSTCQNIVESLGGKIWVNSELGKGSIFSFSIPKKSGDFLK